MKIVIAGCGKRFTNVYYDILRRLSHDLFLWNRTKSKSLEFCAREKINHIDDLGSIRTINPDVVLSFLPPETHYDFVNQVSQYCDCPILLETPGADSRLTSNPKIGSLEQWPFLPLEQFKEILYTQQVLERPYYVFNDGRSFDYHAIAQMRKNLGSPVPALAKASIINGKNEGVQTQSGEINTKPSEWTVGQIEMSNGSLLSYSFSYNCKSMLSIPFQLLRNISSNGSMTSGRSKEMGNDYEIIDVRTVDNQTKKVLLHDVDVDRNDGITRSISAVCSGRKLEWVNKYATLGFDDQQTAIATLVEGSQNIPLYSYYNSYVDYLCINMMKNSSHTQQVVRIR